MLIIRAFVLFSALAALPAQNCTPWAVSFDPDTVHPLEWTTFRAVGDPGSIGLVGFDVLPGPVTVPGIGAVQLGFTPFFQLVVAVLPPSGTYLLPVLAPCKQDLFAMHAQAVSLGGNGSVCLSNPTHVNLQSLGSCSQPTCVLVAGVQSNFNATPIPAGTWIWFNAVVDVQNLPPTGGVLGYRNAKVHFTADNVSYDLPVPNARIDIDPVFASSLTSFDAVENQFVTSVPTGYSGNVFLTGLPFQAPVDLPGHIHVTWSGELVTNQVGAAFTWQWAAAAYSSLTTDLNALCIKPIDGPALNPYPTNELAGTPTCHTGAVIAGARGTGGSNFTGSYSGAQTVTCGGQPGDLCGNGGRPAMLVMKYTGDDCSASQNAQAAGSVGCSGDPMHAPMVMIRATDSSDPLSPSAHVWFQGIVTLGGIFAIDAASAAQPRLSPNTWVYVYDGSANLLQQINFHTSCSQPLRINDQFGSVQLVQLALQ